MGLIRDGWVIPASLGMAAIPETHLTLFNAILADVNANGGPGAGFTPIPG